MVLHYWDDLVEQEELAQELGVEAGVGAPAGRITRLSSRGLDVIYESGKWESVQEWLEKEVPVIALVQAGELAPWRGEYFQHAVVVVGYDSTDILILDPAARPELIVVSIDEFMLGWGEMDYRYVVITPAEFSSGG